MKRRLAIGISGLLVTVGGLSCWLLSNTWKYDSFYIQEPRFPVLVAETITMGLVTLLGVVGLIIFVRWK